MKREVRVHFVGKRGLRWQCKRSDQAVWLYDFIPADDDWEQLESVMEARYRRRNAPWKDLELVKKLRSGE